MAFLKSITCLGIHHPILRTSYFSQKTAQLEQMFFSTISKRLKYPSEGGKSYHTLLLHLQTLFSYSFERLQSLIFLLPQMMKKWSHRNIIRTVLDI